MQVLEPAQLYGISRDDIQQLVFQAVEQVIQKYKHLPKIVYLDTSYLYTFDLADFAYVRRFNLLGRTDPRYPVEWHHFLERWGQDQTVHIFGKRIKPTGYARTVDRVPNEGLINIAASFTGRDFNIMKWHGIGDGADSDNVLHPSPAATQLVHQQSRINVEDSLDGGSLSQEGSTIYVVGNHPKSIPSGAYTESGIFDSENTAIDNMGDYSIFPDEVDHSANADAIGSTTVIYQCST